MIDSTKIEVKEKHPAAIYDYKFDSTKELDRLNDTISSYEIIADSGITIGESTNTAKTITVWVSGGTLGKKYLITANITTAAGRLYPKSFYLKIIPT